MHLLSFGSLALFYGVFATFIIEDLPGILNGTGEDYEDYDYGPQKNLTECDHASPRLPGSNETYTCSHLCSTSGYANEEDGKWCTTTTITQTSTYDEWVNGTCRNGTCVTNASP
uniref:7DB family member n=1 Tax=Ornithodoros moubata TaxID=6938 RepID=M9WFZ6_ORNMO|nr:7DB family member [Ornithodoros moubata]